MKHKVAFDEELWAIVFTAHGEFRLEDTEVTTRMMQEIIDPRGDSSLLVDLRDSPPKVDKEMRKSLE
ncbi:hypothetical protein JXM67_14525 [candidate division WOR-3 bacterium]|nr:hypothetical protein [candidate division WOR-3 bacterium]